MGFGEQNSQSQSKDESGNYKKKDIEIFFEFILIDMQKFLGHIYIIYDINKV